MVTGAVALAEFANVVAEKYPVNVALHTDHCPMQKLDGYMRPLLDISLERVKPGNCRCSSRTCGTARPVPLAENLDIAEETPRQVPPGQHHHGARDRCRRW
jgi:fructose-bisphosphate aldolase class II